MAFDFHQVFQKENWNETKPFKISLKLFSEGGACLLPDPEKKNFLFCLRCLQYHHICQLQIL